MDTTDVGADDETLRTRQVEYQSDLAVVEVRGDVDISTAAIFGAALAHAVAGTGRRVVVGDLTAVRFLSAVGLRVLVEASVDARARGVRLGLVVPESLVMRVLRTSGVTASIPVFATLSEGISELAVRTDGVDPPVRR